MATSSEERRNRVVLGPLPAEFLRLAPAYVADTEDADHQAALALYQQQCDALLTRQPAPLTGRLCITVLQAKLVKNYGITRMDPYVRLRVGHCIYETHTDPSSGKTPRWNKVIHALLPLGVTSIYLEIFDECSFTMDELIAWTHINIPPAVLVGETHEDWFPLNGKQGDGMEGMINLVFTYTVSNDPAVAPYPQVVMVPSTGAGYAAVPLFPARRDDSPLPPLAPVYPPADAICHPVPPPGYPVQVKAELIKQIQEIFPSMERKAIGSVLDANNGDKDATIHCLLQMSE